MSGREFAVSLCAGGAMGIFVVWLCYRSAAALPLAGVIAAVYVRMKKGELGRKRQQLLHYHFRDFLSSLHVALLAGYSVENGVRQAAADIGRLYGNRDVLSLELQEILRQMHYQKTVESLFQDLGRRSGIEDIINFSEILVIAKRTGGNLNRILQSTWRNLCGKIDTKQEIDTMIAARKYEQKIMSLMPGGMILYLRLTFRGFVENIYGNPVGAGVMTVCLCVYACAFFLGRKLTEIRV
jgi:tight adherence protein B